MAEGIMPLLLFGLFLASLCSAKSSPAHESSAKEVILIVEEASERIAAAEEISKNVLGVREGEPMVEVAERAARGAAACLHPLLPVFVVDLTLIGVRERLIGLSDLLEHLLGLFLVVGIFVLCIGQFKGMHLRGGT